MRGSLRRRVLGAYALAVCGLLLLTYLGVWGQQRRFRHAEALRRLEAAVSLFTEAWTREVGKVDRARALAEELAQRFALELLIVDQEGNVLNRSGSVAQWPQYRVWLDHVRRSKAVYPSEALDRARSSLIAVPILENDEVHWVIFWRPRLTATSTLWGPESIVSLALGLVIALSGAWLLLRQLRPLVQLARVCRENGGRQGVPLPDPSLSRCWEIQAIADALQQFIAGQQAGSQVLQEQSDRLWGVLHNLLEGVLLVGRDEKLTLANEASGRLLGFSPASCIGKPIWEVIRHRTLLELVRRVAMLQQPAQLEFSGPVGERQLSARAMPCTGKTLEGVLVVLHDVTELRRLENLRKEFVANISHELKTPLAIISAYAETLRLGAVDDPEYRSRCIGQIEEQAGRLHRMIVDLLQLARVEAGKEVFEFADVSVPEVIDQCLREFAEVARNKGIELNQESSATPLLVNADRQALCTIVYNLLDNALKYTPAGGKVTVRCQMQSGYALLEVQDTGIGISVRDQARVFERFFRSDPARSRQSGGTGLGLAIVKHLTHAMGGDVSVESQEKAGSTFRVRLPLSTAGIPPT